MNYSTALLGTIKNIEPKKRLRLYAGILIILIERVIVISLPFLLKNFLESLTNGTADALTIFGLIAILLALSKFIEAVGWYMSGHLGAYIIKDLYIKAFENLLKQSISYHISRETGKVIANVSRIGGIFWFQMVDVLVKGCGLVVSTLIAFFVLGNESSVLLISLFGVILLYIPIIYLLIKKHLNLRHKLRESEDELQQLGVDSLIGIETVYSFGMQDKLIAKFASNADIMASDESRYQISFRFLEVVSGFIAFTTAIIPYFIYRNDITSGTLSAATLVIIITYTLTFNRQFEDLMWHFRAIVKELPRAEKVSELLDLKHTLYLGNNSGNKLLNNNIEFKNVSFGYNEKYVIQNIDIKIPSNTVTALVGSSGSGKTTIARLLQRYYLPDEGTVLIGDKDYTEYSLGSINKSIAVVPQDPVFFNSTIRENLSIVIDKDVAEIDLIKACKDAEIYDFINSLDNGFDTVVGERGLKLSGGQRQRLAIARVLLRDPSIVIFDEATSMLDSESEQKIHKAFRAIAKDKTVVIIAHRLSTVVHANNILVIENGRIVEQGIHDQLLLARGRYSELWSIQSAGIL
jgi:ATP-binding cassette, subfamily B, heavy metal transporter